MTNKSGNPADKKGLFGIKNIEVSKTLSAPRNKSSSLKKVEEVTVRFGKAMQKVEEVIGDIKMGETIHYVSAGSWSGHNLLVHILDQTGPADVIIATWAISDKGVTAIIKLIEEGLITKLSAVFDYRVRVRTPSAFAMIEYNISTIHMTTCHAKVTTIINKKWHVVIVGSANFTKNPNIEAGVISCDKKATLFHEKWMKDVINNSDPFEIGKGIGKR